MDVIQKLKELGYTTIPAEFYSKVLEWKAWCEGDVKSFHHYKVKTGKYNVNCKMYSLQMAKKLAEDWANLLMNEKVKITAEGSKEQIFLDNVFSTNNFWVKVNEMQEMKASLGTAAYVPRVVGQSENGAEGIAIDYITIEQIYPLKWHNGIVDECAFGSVVYRGEKNYFYLVIHRRNKEKEYVIENYVFEIVNDSLRSAKLEDAFETPIPPIVFTHSKKRQFVIDRLNIANNYDYTLPVGVPCFANAIDTLKAVDLAFDTYATDLITGKRRLFVSPAATEYIDGEPAFDPKDIAFYVLPEDTSGVNKPIQSVGGEFSVVETSASIQTALNLLSAKCGFGENHYRFDSGNITTATQVISENSEMFRTLKKHEIILESVLVELCQIILRLGNASMNAGLNEDVEISIDFDDSVIEDKSADFNRTLQLLNAGLMKPEEARSILMNEDIETAKKALPTMEELTDEEQREVE